MSWQFIATRMNGDGTETPLAYDLPIQNPSVTVELSGPGGITGSISPEIAYLQDDAGRPIIEPWSTAIYAINGGMIRAGGIIMGPLVVSENGSSFNIDAVGFSSYIEGMPWVGAEYSKIQEDPLNIARAIWAHVQEQQDGNLGLSLPSLTSPVKVGTEVKETNFETGAGETVSFESGPYKLAEWLTTNLGEEFDKLAEGTPFDYIVEHTWDGSDASSIQHHMRLGYPRLGRRLHKLRFAVGENVLESPDVEIGSDYASETLVLGAGEGRARIRGRDNRRTGRLRHVAVIEDSSIRAGREARNRAAEELKWRSGEPTLTEMVTVQNHPNARLGEYGPGDEILLVSGPGYAEDVSFWVRVISMTIDPATDEAALTIMRA